MATVFLDANVLFSAAYRSDAGFLRLWDIPDAELISSDYAVQEARRNLALPDQKERLDSLVLGLRLVRAIPDAGLPESVRLPDKDRPILLAAIAAGASHLVTGDLTHFGELFGKRIGGVLVMSPSEFLLAESGNPA